MDKATFITQVGRDQGVELGEGTPAACIRSPRERAVFGAALDWSLPSAATIYHVLALPGSYVKTWLIVLEKDLVVASVESTRSAAKASIAIHGLKDLDLVFQYQNKDRQPKKSYQFLGVDLPIWEIELRGLPIRLKSGDGLDPMAVAKCAEAIFEARSRAL